MSKDSPNQPPGRHHIVLPSAFCHIHTPHSEATEAERQDERDEESSEYDKLSVSHVVGMVIVGIAVLIWEQLMALCRRYRHLLSAG